MQLGSFSQPPYVSHPCAVTAMCVSVCKKVKGKPHACKMEKLQKLRIQSPRSARKVAKLNLQMLANLVKDSSNISNIVNLAIGSRKVTDSIIQG